MLRAYYILLLWIFMYRGVSMKSVSRAVRFTLRLVSMLLTAAVLVVSCTIPSRKRISEDPSAAFIDRTYQILFQKSCEGERFSFWFNNLKEGNTSAIEMIDMLMQSFEYQQKNYTDEQTIDVICRLMTEKEPSASVKENYLRYLNNGVTYRCLLSDMSGSQEFTALCERYKVNPGKITNLEGRDQNPAATVFVGEMYEEFNGAKAGAQDLNNWSAGLLSGDGVAPFLNKIVTGSGYASKAHSDEQVVDSLCRVMLGREANASEKEQYAEVLNNGVSISYVTSLIAKTPEFKSRCESLGMVPGEVILSEPRDMNYELTSFLTRLYTRFSGNRPSGEDLNSYVEGTIEDPSKVRDAITEMFSDPESQALLSSDDDFLSAVFEVFYGHEPSSEKVESYKIGLSHGITRERVLSEILKDPAFDEKMSEYGIDTHVEPVVPEKVIALTFDDGPYTPVTMRILDALEPYGAHATFFVVGNRVGNYKECVIRATNMGCEIGDHTWSHQTLTKLSADGVQSQIGDCASTVYNLTGIYPHVMRPVGGSYNTTVSNNVGMPMIIWSIDTNDWKYKDSQHVINEVLNYVKDGDIVLMHDLYESTATAVETIVPALIEAGYTLVTVSELAEYKKVQMENGKAYFSMRG